MKDIINIDKTISRELLRDKDNLWEILYVGDSILGYNVRLVAGVILSN